MALTPTYRTSSWKNLAKTTASLLWPATLPDNVQDGDLVIVAITTNGSAGTMTAPSGWTLISSVTSPATNPHLHAWRKFWYEGDPMTAVFTGTTSVAGGINATAFSGVDPQNAMDVAAVNGGSSTAGTAQTNAGITTVTNNALVVGINAANSSSATFTGPSSTQPTLTERYDSGSQRTQTMATGNLGTAGATGTITWTCSASLAWANMVFALRPDPQRTFPTAIHVEPTWIRDRNRRQMPAIFSGPGSDTAAGRTGMFRGGTGRLQLDQGLQAGGAATTSDLPRNPYRLGFLYRLCLLLPHPRT